MGLRRLLAEARKRSTACSATFNENQRHGPTIAALTDLDRPKIEGLAPGTCPGTIRGYETDWNGTILLSSLLSSRAGSTKTKDRKSKAWPIENRPTKNRSPGPRIVATIGRVYGFELAITKAGKRRTFGVLQSSNKK